LFGVKNVNPKVLLTAPTNFRRTPPEIVIAIPTVKRIEKEYFKDMIQNLMKNIEHYEWRNVLFLVFVANFPSDEKSSIDIINWLNLTFPKAVNQGLFEVIEPPELYYPSDLDLIEPTFNDSRERMVWRTKQNLDYAYLMTYARLSRFSSRFYLQIEDDVLSAPGNKGLIFTYLSNLGYVNEILKYANSNPKFLTIDYASLGFIGKLFHIYDLHLFINSILMFYRDKPVDWILDQYFYSRFCSPEKNGCVNRINGVHRFHRKPSLFQVSICVSNRLKKCLACWETLFFARQTAKVERKDVPKD
jgi:alpha-1,3-mannosylglycoprotein beta-1,4-N-acetylglucosaminyltransferase A/B